MARKKNKKTKKTAPKSMSRLAPDPKDEAATLALYRWYVVTIEKILLEAYATSPEKSDEFVKVLRAAITKLYAAGKRPGDMAADGCDEGYECCDGMCAPMCGV